jgi:hypothetical protein
VLDSPWERKLSGVDLTAARKFLINQWWRASSEPVMSENLLAAPGRWGQLDYASLESPNVDGCVRWTIEKPAVMHGFYVWFDCETAPGLVCSNAPNAPATVYGRAFFPLERPVNLQIGDELTLRISANLIGDSYLYRWHTKVVGLGGEPRASFRQSTFNSRPVSKADLAPVAMGQQPPLELTGQIALCVLKAMAKSATFEEISDDLMRRFPDIIPNVSTALGRIRQVRTQLSMIEQTK